jgi:ubiquinone/menaquinone biosynthesis C-methylase UbiE
MDQHLKAKLKASYQDVNDPAEVDDIPVFLSDDFVVGDNAKYMKMYNWMSHGYDFVERVVGRLKYGNTINEIRKTIISKLEWKNGVSVLYVSIGTGTDLQFIPEDIDRKTLDIVGVDISIGMLKACKKKCNEELNPALVNCCAEDLPFRDNEFDIVFHVGGINFFNDKEKAISEMIRVAKNGARILIADETDSFVQQQYKKSIWSKKYFAGQSFNLHDFEATIPEKMKEKKTELLWGGKFYCITFRK